ncbi:MAG: tetratricopeptide repeat protein [Crocinitomicaceae bacterium]
MHRKLLSFILLLFIALFSFGQTKVERVKELEQKLEKATTDTARITILCDICVNTRYYDVERAHECAEQALTLGLKSGSKNHLTRALVESSAISVTDGDYSKGILYAQKALEVLNADTVNVLNNDFRTSKLLGRVYNTLGTAYDYNSEFSHSIHYYLKAKNVFENIGNIDGLGVSYNNLGISYLYVNDLDKAESCFNEAYKIYTSIGETATAGSAKMNLGIIYHYRSDFETAIQYYQESYQLMKELGNLKSMGHCITNIGEAYASLGIFDSALVYSRKGEAIDVELNDLEGLGTDFRGRGNIFMAMDNLDSAKYYHIKALDIAREINRKVDIAAGLSRLAMIEEQLGNYKEALAYQTEYTLQNDTIRKESNSTALGKVEAQAEFDKEILKEKEESKRRLEVEEAKRSRQSIITYLTIAILVVILFFVYMLLKSLKLTRQQKELVVEAKAEIEEKNTELTDSIKYAQRIQMALLNEDENDIAVLPSHFILFKPKDIVSGDFYWSYHIDDYWYIAAADCTGHGVPGAMLTMLGTAYLNEICAGGIVHTPSEILDQLKAKITKELSQKGQAGESKDGMDMSLMRINLKTNEVQWSGANNPLYQIRSGELSEIKADKQPIGYSDNVKPFSNHLLDIQKGDSVYLFTDGYADQFGGEKGKKFKYSNFKKILIETDTEEGQKQHDILDKTIESWRGELEQLDDICIVGIRF